MEIGVTGSGRLQRPDRLAGISEASNSIGGIGAVALIQLKRDLSILHLPGKRLRTSKWSISEDIKDNLKMKLKVKIENGHCE